jgi:hypothetical protein
MTGGDRILASGHQWDNRGAFPSVSMLVTFRAK